MVAGLERAARRKRYLGVFLIVLINAVPIGSVGSLLVLSQPSGEPNPYLSSVQWSNSISSQHNLSCVLVEGIIVNPRKIAISNVTLTLDVYVHYICHHDLNHHTRIKRQQVNFGSLAGETDKTFSVEVLYQNDLSHHFRYVDCGLSWTR